MLHCAICAADTVLPTPRETRDTFVASVGDVCMVHASISTPVELIFQATQAIREDPDALARSQLALETIRGREIGKSRPCILARQGIPGARQTKVYLMGTLKGKSMDDDSVAVVLREFAKPIFPNLGLPGSRHYHTTPPWPHEYQWLIGYPVAFDDIQALATPWRFKPRGRYPPDPPGTTYAMDVDSVDSLNDHCLNTFIAWELRCKNEAGFLQKCERQWRVRVVSRLVILVFLAQRYQCRTRRRV